ncbi:redox-sensitive transcriptional activator SoxR [Angustibacter sp. McL0619]|uniref:redox-sensitive transcriptional activator SoxR n=1 Tax=Angustibacter sp. McL0619 TaxID=3415676 RepID=UPI003CEBEC64
MPSTSDHLVIGDVARRSGMASSAIRYYESQGLLASTRTTGGQRRFPRAVLRRLAFIRAAQNVGLSLDEIRAALDTLPSGRTPTKADWARLSRSWQARLDEQIAALERLRDGLTTCIGCGCLSLQRCRLSNPDDVLGETGPGARYLPPALRASSQR